MVYCEKTFQKHEGVAPVKNSIVNSIHLEELSPDELRTLIRVAQELAEAKENDGLRDRDVQLTDIVFSEGRVCPHCGHTHVIKNGKDHPGFQRYLCKNETCGRTFSIATGTVLQASKKGVADWEKALECMSQKMTCRQIAQAVGINKDTARIWRYKLAGALSKLRSATKTKGKVEADEKVMALSFKGNHAKTKDYHEMHRPPHKSGGQAGKRGVSKEQVTVPTAVDAEGRAVAGLGNRGSVKAKALEIVLGNQIDEDASLHTDKCRAYQQLARKLGIDLHQHKDGKSADGKRMMIPHVNACHTGMEGFIDVLLHGVATKYLQFYLDWYTQMLYCKESFQGGLSALIRMVFTTGNSVRWKELTSRPAIPCVA